VTQDLLIRHVSARVYRAPLEQPVTTDGVLAPLLTAQGFASPREAFEHLTRATAVLAMRCAEPGPFAQAIAGIDIALWDLSARRAGQPLWRFLDGAANPPIGVYASGLNPDAPEGLAAAGQSQGFTAFKLKIDFGAGPDTATCVRCARRWETERD
jgi:L-alanine-DL-glutamate epimerase-like enolase superfamily enzyme